MNSNNKKMQIFQTKQNKIKRNLVKENPPTYMSLTASLT